MGIVKKVAGKIVKDVTLPCVIDGAIKVVDATEKAVAGVCNLIDNHKAKVTAKERQKGIIRLGRAASEYAGMRYIEVENELRAYGFTDISLLPRKDLGKDIKKKKKDGLVMDISIGGKNKFGAKSYFKLDDKVIISYISL